MGLDEYARMLATDIIAGLIVKIVIKMDTIFVEINILSNYHRFYIIPNIFLPELPQFSGFDTE